VLLGTPRETERPLRAVVRQCLRTDDLRERSFGCPALKLQLKQPVPSHHIPKTTSTILFCGCEDVGNAAVIVNDENRVSQPWDETAGLPG